VAEPLAGADVMRSFLPASPFAAHLGLELIDVEPDRASVAMPFSPALATMGEVVHGGAIGALVDTAAMAASWATSALPAELRGSTVGLTVDFLAPAHGRDLVATARVLRRGSSLCFCDVEVAEEGAHLVAKGLVTYKLG
jgi:uncharacterized protein (TIGR00369 family)